MTNATKKTGPWIQTLGGRAFHYFDPQPPVDVAEIAHALSNICRFNGHCQRFYSVAEHSMLCSLILVPQPILNARQLQLAKEGLFHDAVEAYMGDMTQPLKYELRDYRALEKQVEPRVFRALGIGLNLDPLVKEVDLRLLMTERAQLLGKPPQPWHEDLERIKPLDIGLECLPPPQAKQAFLRRWEQIQTAERELKLS